jgi:VanZ family protein
MHRILFIVAALILYGSLYPWDFHYHPLGANPLWIIFHSWPERLTRNLLRDAILNVLLYMPLGAAGFMTFARRYRAAVNLALTLAVGISLSTFVEVIQFFVRSRQSSPLDITTNTFGTLIGAAMTCFFFPQLETMVLSRRHRWWNQAPGAFALTAIWLGYQFFPLVPSFGYTRLPSKILATFRAPFSGLEVLACAAEGLALGILLEAILGRGNARTTLAWFLLAIPARLLMMGRTLELSDLVGAAAAFALWSLLPGGTLGRYRAGAAFALATLLLRGCAPFHFAAARAAFWWRPFTASMGFDWLSSALVLMRKLFDYGSAVWLLHMARLRPATLLVTLLLAGIEVAQMWLPGRTPESTDPLLALMLGFVLWRLEKNRGWDTVAPQAAVLKRS